MVPPFGPAFLNQNQNQGKIMELSNIVLTDEAINVIDNGAWVADLPGADGLELYVIGMESEEAKKAMVSAQANARIKSEGKPLTSEEHANATRSVLAEVVLKDWRGLTSDGQEVKYEKAKAIQWITSRNGERLAGLALIAAQRLDSSAQSFVEQVAKN